MEDTLINRIAQASPVLKFCECIDGASPLWNYDRHTHPYIELIYSIRGSVRRRISETVQEQPLYTAVIHPANFFHQDTTRPDPNNQVYCLWVDAPAILPEEPIVMPDHNGELEALFRSIYEESRRKEPLEPLISLMLRTLMIQIVRTQESSLQPRIERIVQYLNLHMAEQISVSELCRMEHVSRSFLSKQFKAQTGLSIIQYVHHLRLNAARRLLITTDRSIEEIAAETGFPSSKYFFRLFRAAEQMPPREYRKKHKI